MQKAPVREGSCRQHKIQWSSLNCGDHMTINKSTHFAYGLRTIILLVKKFEELEENTLHSPTLGPAAITKLLK